MKLKQSKPALMSNAADSVSSSALPYTKLLTEIKSRIHIAQTKAVLAVNREMVFLYWDIGRILSNQQESKGWGAKVFLRLSIDIKNEIPEVKGFSERNLKFMSQFFREYPYLGEALGKQAVSLNDTSANPLILLDNFGQQLVAQIPWGHNILLMQRVKELEARYWYIQQTIDKGWSRSVLLLMIENQTYKRQGKSINNFSKCLPPSQSDLVLQALKDPYIFDFLTLEKEFHERELETGLLQHVQKFLLELGQGFCFVGRQYHVEVGNEDFYIDLLFYHLKLRCFIVIDLKKGQFKPEHAGKLNFYLNLVNDKLKQKEDNLSIGLILCQEKNKVVAEYALQSINQPIGVSEYEITRALPISLKSSLPTIEELERELAESAKLSKKQILKENIKKTK